MNKLCKQFSVSPDVYQAENVMTRFIDIPHNVLDIPVGFGNSKANKAMPALKGLVDGWEQCDNYLSNMKCKLVGRSQKGEQLILEKNEERVG